jgi:alkylhydroperoxidase/carboxymuconolactone decarboxylase family protein YurZ
MNLDPLYQPDLAALAEAGHAGPWSDALGRLAGLSASSGALPDHVREIGLALAFAGRGMEGEARRHGQRALDAGITRAQVIEALLTGVLHGGMGVFWGNAWLIDAAPEGEALHPAGDPQTIDSVRGYFTDVWGGQLPVWVQAIADAGADLLLAYYDVREAGLGDGTLPKKHKELLIALMSCVEHYDFGIETHIKVALDRGATADEVIETVKASLIGGGIVAWLHGFPIAARLIAEHGG